MLRTSLIFGLTASLVSCASHTSTPQEAISSKEAVVLGPQRIDVAPASAAQCPNGGSVYTVFNDQNSNGVLEPVDIVITANIVCNGTNGANGSNGSNGANGHSPLITMNRVNVDLSACASGSGLQINMGLDLNDNLSLENSEISSPAILCDGANGAAGQAGPSGSNGYGMTFETAAASVQDCPAGGRTIVMALDVDGSHSISAADQNLQSLTLCNGQNAATTDYTPVAPILACGNTSPYKEVLLRLSNGQVLGSFSNNTGGDMTRLAFLPDGTFMNTDNSGCVFSLSTSQDGGTRSISWFGAVQMSWGLN